MRPTAPEPRRPLLFRVLGGLQLCTPGGQLVDLAGDRQRRLLAALLAHAGGVVSTDRLADHLWEQQQPQNPAAALQNQVSRLRRALRAVDPAPDQLLATVPPGYRLSPPAGALDAAVFDRLLAAASCEPAAAAVDTLQTALGLWRGPAYAELADTDAVRVEAIRLEEARIAATERLGGLLVDLGRFAEAVPLLEAFVSAHPLHETARRHLLVALASLGRSAHALQHYQDYREHLADELGLEPSSAMQELHMRILRQEAPAGPAPSNGAPAQPPTEAAVGSVTDAGASPRAVRSSGGELRITYVSTPAGQLAVGRLGSGPAMIALPGWLSSLDLVAAGQDPRSSVLRRLAEHFTVVMYDRRGTGLSRTCSADGSLPAAVDELRRVIEHVGAPATLFAMSQAGPVAVTLAAQSPSLVSKLLFFGTYAHGETAFANEELRSSLVSMLRSHYGLGSLVIAQLYRPNATPEAARHLARVIRESASQGVAADYLESIYAADVRDLLPRVKAPALVLHYRTDRVIPFAGGAQLAAGLPDVRFRPLPGGYHLPDARDLDTIVDAVLEFTGAGAALPA